MESFFFFVPLEQFQIIILCRVFAHMCVFFQSHADLSSQFFCTNMTISFVLGTYLCTFIDLLFMRFRFFLLFALIAANFRFFCFLCVSCFLISYFDLTCLTCYSFLFLFLLVSSTALFCTLTTYSRCFVLFFFGHSILAPITVSRLFSVHVLCITALTSNTFSCSVSSFRQTFKFNKLHLFYWLRVYSTSLRLSSSTFVTFSHCVHFVLLFSTILTIFRATFSHYFQCIINISLYSLYT